MLVVDFTADAVFWTKCTYFWHGGVDHVTPVSFLFDACTYLPKNANTRPNDVRSAAARGAALERAVACARKRFRLVELEDVTFMVSCHAGVRLRRVP